MLRHQNDSREQELYLPKELLDLDDGSYDKILRNIISDINADPRGRSRRAPEILDQINDLGDQELTESDFHQEDHLHQKHRDGNPILIDSAGPRSGLRSGNSSQVSQPSYNARPGHEHDDLDDLSPDVPSLDVRASS